MQQHTPQSETASLAALITLILVVFVSVVAWRVSVDPSMTTLVQPASAELAFSALAPEPTALPAPTAAPACEKSAYVTGDLAGNANPAVIFAALCPSR
jgi:hypothetical protein